MPALDWKPLWRQDNRIARRRPWLAAFTGLLAVFAYGGTIGLITGAIDFGAVVTGRLPFHSTVFAAISLAVVVGVPMTAVIFLGARRDTRTSPVAVLAGVTLIGWIVVEIGVIRTYHVLQPVCALAGLAVLMAGLKDFGAPGGHGQ